LLIASVVKAGGTVDNCLHCLLPIYQGTDPGLENGFKKARFLGF